MPRRGTFITFEGCEGVGKSTQIGLLKDLFESRGENVVFTREPGGAPIAEKIRGIILDASNHGMDSFTELLLYEAARREHAEHFIKPALRAGSTVICDRFIDSTLAYQGFGRGMDKDKIRTLNSWAAEGLIIDLTIFLDLDPAAGFLRKGGADKSDRLENEEHSFHERVYEGFKKIAELEPERVFSVDASGEKDATHAAIVALLKSKGIFKNGL